MTTEAQIVAYLPMIEEVLATTITLPLAYKELLKRVPNLGMSEATFKQLAKTAVAVAKSVRSELEQRLEVAEMVFDLLSVTQHESSVTQTVTQSCVTDQLLDNNVFNSGTQTLSLPVTHNENCVTQTVTHNELNAVTHNEGCVTQNAITQQCESQQMNFFIPETVMQNSPVTRYESCVTQTVTQCNDVVTHYDINAVTQSTPKSFNGWTVAIDSKGFIRMHKRINKRLRSIYIGRGWNVNKATLRISEATM